MMVNMNTFKKEADHTSFSDFYRWYIMIVYCDFRPISELLIVVVIKKTPQTYPKSQ